MTFYQELQLNQAGSKDLLKKSETAKEKIYHLPFDQQYDRIAIDAGKGECYTATVKEAEKLGFRRAFRHRAAEKA